MKTKILSFGLVSLGLAVTGLLLLAGRMQGRQTEASSPETLLTFSDATPIDAPSAETAALPTDDTPSASPDQLPSVLAQPTTPSGVKLSKGAFDIARFAQGGISPDVMLAYIGNANTRFDLGSDQIVYLNDLGVSGEVVKAMIQRDASLDAQSQAYVASQSAAPTAPATPTDLTAYPPAPPMDDSAGLLPSYDQAPAVMAGDDSQYFYNTLAPYGSWINVAGCGPCWQPTVCVIQHDWRPYGDRGRWVYSDCGWYWQSDYSWGWAAFHYGRWFEDRHCGWVWRPDRVWGPAWVSWRASGEHCGWAPLPPSARFIAGRGFMFGNHSVGAGFEFGLLPRHYTFVPIARLSDYSPARYAVGSREAERIGRETKVITHVTEQNHRIVASGVDPHRVATLSRTEIRQVQIHDVPQNGSHLAQADRMHKSGGNLVINRQELPAASSHSTTVRNGHESYPAGSLILHGNPQAVPTHTQTSVQTQAPAPTYNQRQYTSVNGSAQPHYSSPAQNQGASTYVIPGHYTAAQHSSSSTTSPYHVHSTPAPTEPARATSTWGHSPEAAAPLRMHAEPAAISQSHVHTESHTPSYSAPAPAPAPATHSSSAPQSSSSGNSTTGKK